MKVRTFSLGDGADTVVFADSTSNNGVDTITNFKAGQKNSGGDVLKVFAFLEKAASTNTTAVDLADNSTNKLNLNGSNNVGIIKKYTGDLLVTDIASTDTEKKIFVGDGKKAVVLVTSDANANSAATYDIYYVTGNSSAAATVEKVGTVTTDAAFDGENFA